MTDLKALEALVFQKVGNRGKPLSKLGYFCAPFQPETGPFSDKVVKIYQNHVPYSTLETLLRHHDDYINVLTRLGIRVPETEIHLLENGSKLVPVIVQDAIHPKFMMRYQMQLADLQRALELMDSAGLVIARFWNALTQDMGRVGFHPSIRNFAVIDKEAIFFDSFPPLIHYSHVEMGEILLKFSESLLIRFVGPFVPQMLARIQDEWYSPSQTLIGLVGSACRLRPSDQGYFLDWGREFAHTHLPQFSNEIIEGLQRVPQLPGYWTSFRKLLRLQGKPNI